MPVYTRASRDYQFVPGSGSSLEVAQIDALGNQGTPAVLDIKQGFLVQTFRNVNTTHSGSNGADLHTRVGAGWTFALVLDFPAQIIGGALAAGFLESLLGSSRSVALKFNVGDPLFWTSQSLPVRSFQAAKALLETTENRFDATGTQVVGINAAGIGNSLLYTYLDDAPQHPQLWF